MDRLTKVSGFFHQRIRTTALLIIFICAALFLLIAAQYTAAALLPVIVLLLRAIERRDQRAQALAERITDERQIEKVEVPAGAWGALARAVNGLLQERRVEQRLRDALPEPLPLEAVQSLLGGDLSIGGQSRPVAVLLVSTPARAPAWEQGVRPAALAAWQGLARSVQEAGRRYGALMQPCGDAVMLVFGAFEERPASESLRDALAAATLLQHDWQHGADGASALALSLASGHALAAALPGLGFCVVGTPVEQAVGLQQLAARARRSGLLCNEEAYRSLRHDTSTVWQPTDLRISIANRPPQVVYRWDHSA